MKKVRKATLDDIQQIATIQVTTWQDIYHNVLEPEYLSTMTVDKQRDMWTYILTSTRHQIFVYEVDNRIVGFLAIGKERNQNIDIDLEIYALYVLPDYQHQSIGHMLFQQAIDYLKAQQAKSLILWVLADNPSVSFYQQQGAIIDRQERVKLGNKMYVELGFIYKIADDN